MKKIIILMAILTLIVLSACSPGYNYIELGTVIDFDVSAGGFGSVDKAVVRLDNNESHLITQAEGVNKLKTGMKLCGYETESNMFYRVRKNCDNLSQTNNSTGE